MNFKKRILIIRLSSIGDVLLATPFIRQTRISFPDAAIDFVVKKKFIDLIKYNPHLHKIYSIDENEGISGLWRLRKKLLKNEYDYIFDLHNNIRSRILTFNANSQVFRIKKDKLKRALLVYLKINTYKTVLPIPERYLKVGEKAGVKDDLNGLEIFWKNHIEEGLLSIFDRGFLQKGYVVIAPGAGFKTKQWLPNYFKDLIKKLVSAKNINIILLGGQKEAKSFEALRISDKVFNLAGELSLLETAIVISKAKFLVSNDSGLMHLATAVNTPVLAIFGSTVKELGFFPFRSEHKICENENLWCRPCSHIGRNFCPLFHFKCMKDIKPQAVFNQLESWM